MQQDRGLGRAFYIPALDGWRAIAVGLVIGAHCVPALINSGWKVGKYAAAGFERGGRRRRYFLLPERLFDLNDFASRKGTDENHRFRVVLHQARF